VILIPVKKKSPVVLKINLEIRHRDKVLYNNHSGVIRKQNVHSENEDNLKSDEN
jgi:hypothetical protein